MTSPSPAGIASGLAQEGVTTQKYTFTVTPSSDGQDRHDPRRPKDPAGNDNTASNVAVTFDRTTPHPVDDAVPDQRGIVTVAVDFGEPIDAPPSRSTTPLAWPRRAAG